jgi:hypothetical protein
MEIFRLPRFLAGLALLLIVPAASSQPALLDSGYRAPWTEYGQPDLQGIWSNAVVTPLERPAELGEKAFLNEEEAAAYEQARLNATNRDQRTDDASADILNAYNDFWWDSGTNIVATRRTSLIIDPPDGRVPKRSPAAQARLAAATFRGNASHEETGLSTRCIHWSIVGPPMLPGSYNNNYQIVQTEDFVLLVTEMGHNRRVIPLGGSPAPEGISQWLGISSGHFEGDTLVVETTGFNGMATFQGSGENMHLTERFTRVADDILLYEFTVDDPESFDSAWTAQIPSTRVDDLMYEYACHEGNRGLLGVLTGARLSEAQEAEGEPQ